jgi:hypothetical protein
MIHSQHGYWLDAFVQSGGSIMTSVKNEFFGEIEPIICRFFSINHQELKL